MDTQRTCLFPAISTKFNFILFLTLLFHHTLSFPATTTTTAATNPFDFIRSSCNTTLYPDICYTSLSPYASAILLDPAQLARIAIGVTLIQARHVATSFSNMTQQAGYSSSLDPRAASALHDCCSTFYDAVDQIQGSLKQITGTGTGTGTAEAMRFRLSIIQTWLSAALTNENTCTDGFQDVAECPVKDKVVDSLVTVTQLTSNALALVNSFANFVNSR